MVPTPPPTIVLEGQWEWNTSLSAGYDFGKWNVQLRHRYHRQFTDRLYRSMATLLGNRPVLHHHDLGIIASRNLVSAKGRFHQLGLGFVASNMGSRFNGYDANQPDVFPAVIRNA